MTKKQILLTNLSQEGPSKSLSELNLAFLRKLAKNLAENSPNQSAEGLNLAVKIIGHLNLAARNLFPAPFNQSDLSSALFKYFSESFFGEEQGLHIDGTEIAETPITGRQNLDGSTFAQVLTSPLIINAVDWPDTPDQLIKWVSQTIDQSIVKESNQENSSSESPKNSSLLPQIKAIGQSNLSTGWAQEVFGQSTQVFTPENIAQHLAAEVFDCELSAGTRLLDPACGAGHLLIPAAEHWLSLLPNDKEKQSKRENQEEVVVVIVEKKQEEKNSDKVENSEYREKLEKLQQLLSEVITGLDVDLKLLQLCGFSLYLLARDQLSDLRDLRNKQQNAALCELPLPRLFLSKSSAGSLTLGTNNNSVGIDLQDWFDLQAKPAPKLSGITYNQIVMNPPYLSTRIMGDTTGIFLKRYYPDSSGDLYTAFIELASRLLAPGGKLSMIVQQSFLSVQRYRAFRLKLLEHCHITSCLTLGFGNFSARRGEKINSAILTLERKEDQTSSLNGKSKSSKNSEIVAKPTNRMMRVGRMENKNLSANLIAEETALATMAAISGNPFAFDCPAALANCFKSLPALSEIDGIALVNGLFTCNNNKFVKLDSQLSESEKNLYVPYDKGGGQKWYHKTSYRLLWPDNGDNIRQYRKERGQSRSLPGEEFYFKPGLTYSYIGTTGFKARLLSEKSIFDIASSAIFSEEIDRHYLLGFLNSSLTIYLLGVLNPTINFQIGDLRRLPFSAPTAEISTQISSLSKKAIKLMRNWHENQKDINAIELIEAEKKIQMEIDTIIFHLYKIDKATETIIRDNEWVVGSRKKLLK